MVSVVVNISIYCYNLRIQFKESMTPGFVLDGKKMSSKQFDFKVLRIPPIIIL